MLSRTEMFRAVTETLMPSNCPGGESTLFHRHVSAAEFCRCVGVKGPHNLAVAQVVLCGFDVAEAAGGKPVFSFTLCCRVDGCCGGVAGCAVEEAVCEGVVACPLPPHDH